MFEIITIALLSIGSLFGFGADAVGGPVYPASNQLAPNPQNGYILSTDTTDNFWIANTGGSGGGSSFFVFTPSTNILSVLTSPTTTPTTTLDAYKMTADVFTGSSSTAPSVFPSVSITNATTTDLAVTGGAKLFGTVGHALSDFCVAITGGAGLCDGTDGGGAGGGLGTTSPWTAGNIALVVDDGTLTGSSSISANLIENLSGSNTGDVTLAGSLDYLTISNQIITRNAVNLSTDVTGTLDEGNIDANIARDSELHDAVTMSGTPNYITLSGQDIVRGTVDIGDDTNATAGNGVGISGDTFNFDCSDVTDSGANDGIGCSSEDLVVTINNANWSGTDLSVANGGTGASTLTNGGILLGSGTGAITAMSALANGSIVVGDGTNDPVALAAFTSSTGDVTHEAGGLEADVSGYTNGIYGMLSGVTADIDTLSEFNTALGGSTLSGLDATIITGTAGTSGNCVEWDANGDIVDAGDPCGTGGGGGGSTGGGWATTTDRFGTNDNATVETTYTSNPVLIGGSSTTSAPFIFDTQHSIFTLSSTTASAGSITVDGAAIIDSTSGNATLDFIDTLGSTAEATIEAAIDTLSNLTSVGTIVTGTWAANLAADTVDAITEIAAALRTGADAFLVTGTAGGGITVWNGDGDVVGSGVSTTSLATTPRSLGSIGSTSKDRLLNDFANGTTTWSAGTRSTTTVIANIYGDTDTGTCLVAITDGSATTSVVADSNGQAGSGTITVAARDEILVRIGSCASTPNWVIPDWDELADLK